MATKPKTTESTASAQGAGLDTMFVKALEQFNGGQLKEAAAAFAALQAEAGKLEDIRLGRSAQSYLKAIQTRLDLQESPAAEAPELAAQLALNRHDPDAALARVEAALQAGPEQAGLLYLKAVALAQLEQVQPSADALVKATGLEPGLIYQFRLEADFDGVRHAAAFQVFNRG